eukprot:GHVH01002003.1.p1 GENE.GHVH01002003.1~~GHVH01002003.1.p1  ORF type:complete len:379 (+),score=47.80 GHVH01002003.1:959-2095(+)
MTLIAIHERSGTSQSVIQVLQEEADARGDPCVRKPLEVPFWICVILLGSPQMILDVCVSLKEYVERRQGPPSVSSRKPTPSTESLPEERNHAGRVKEMSLPGRRATHHWLQRLASEVLDLLMSILILYPWRTIKTEDDNGDFVESEIRTENILCQALSQHGLVTASNALHDLERSWGNGDSLFKELDAIIETLICVEADREDDDRHELFPHRLRVEERSSFLLPVCDSPLSAGWSRISDIPKDAIAQIVHSLRGGDQVVTDRVYPQSVDELALDVEDSKFLLDVVERLRRVGPLPDEFESYKIQAILGSQLKNVHALISYSHEALTFEYDLEYSKMANHVLVHDEKIKASGGTLLDVKPSMEEVAMSHSWCRILEPNV